MARTLKGAMQKPGISAKSSITYCLSYAARELSQGIGKSRYQAEHAHGGHTDKIHSSNTFKRYMSVAHAFVSWCKDEGLNRLDKVTSERLNDYIDRRLDAGLAKNTLKVEVMALNKFLVDGLGRNDLRIKEVSELASQGKSAGQCMPFNNAQRVIDNLHGATKAISEIAYHTSARVAETKKIQIDTERQIVTIKGKGGKVRENNYSDRPEKFRLVVEAKERLDTAIKEHGWQEIRRNAYGELHNAERAAGDVVQGFHGFRASYIEGRYNELDARYEAEGRENPAEDADKQTGHEAGHERADTTRHYRMA